MLDERDATLRSQLGSVKDGSTELTRLTAGAGGRLPCGLLRGLLLRWVAAATATRALAGCSACDETAPTLTRPASLQPNPIQPTEAEALLKDARSEVSAMVNSKKNEKQSELDKVYNEAKAKVTRETESAIAGLCVCVYGRRRPGRGACVAD